MEEPIPKKVGRYQDDLKSPTYNSVHNYLLTKRGLSNESIDKFNLGVNEQGNISIPIKDISGNIIGIKFRANPFKEYSSKYWHTKGLNNSIFNLDSLKTNSELIITEGEFDAMILSQYGYSAISQTTGSSISINTLQELIKLKQPKRIIVALDTDTAGIRSMYNLAKDLDSLIDNIEFVEIEGAKDWTDLVTKTNSDLSLKIALQLENSSSPKGFIRKHYQRFENGFLKTIAVSDVSDEQVSFLAKPLFVRNGINLITASPKSLKSMIVVNLLVTAMERSKFLGILDTTSVNKALLIDQESIKAEVKNRIKSMQGNTDQFLMTAEQVFFDVDENITKKVLKTIEIEGIDVVVIDTLRRVNRDMDENSSKDVSQFFSKIIPIAQKATVILIHHETKSTGKFGGSSYRGSGDILGAVDSHIYIQTKSKSSKRTVIKISHPNARYSSSFEDIEVEFVNVDGLFKFNYLGSVESNSEEQEKEIQEERLSELLIFIESGKASGKSTSEIREYCKINFEGMGAHKAREHREILLERKEILRVDNFEGGKSTHFLSKEFSIQHDNNIDIREVEHEKQ